MTLIDLRDIKAKQPTQDRARNVIQIHQATPNELIGPSPGPIARKRLDVDAVLARSLPRLSADEL